jgi:uncharacterized protein YtpQ (UPF0354 family)
MPDQPDQLFEPNPGLILPRIKQAEFNNALKAAGAPPDQWPVTEPLVGNLIVTYAFDLPAGFVMVRPQDLAELGLPPEQLRKLSLDNLKREMPEIAVEVTGDVHRVITGKNFEACTLLAPNLWTKIAAQINGEVIVAVPSRDVVLFCSSLSPQGLTDMVSIANEVLRQEAAHALTNELFVWRGGWQVFHANA